MQPITEMHQFLPRLKESRISNIMLQRINQKKCLLQHIPMSAKKISRDITLTYWHRSHGNRSVR